MRMLMCRRVDRWCLVRRAAKTETFKSTFIAEDPKTRKKARLSWYHPDDTVRADRGTYRCCLQCAQTLCAR